MATGEKNSKVAGSFYLPKEPGYVETAKMLMEAGLTLVQLVDDGKVCYCFVFV